MNVNDLLGNISRDSAGQLTRLMSTPEGQEILKKIKNMDKNEIMRQLGAIDKSNAPGENLIRQIANDPGLLRKLNNILDRK